MFVRWEPEICHAEKIFYVEAEENHLSSQNGSLWLSTFPDFTTELSGAIGTKHSFDKQHIFYVNWVDLVPATWILTAIL